MSIKSSPPQSRSPLETFPKLTAKGITDGKAYVGMSKDGVRIALGYPAVNRTAIAEQQHMGIREKQMDLHCHYL